MEFLQTLWALTREHYILVPLLAILLTTILASVAQSMGTHFWYIVAVVGAGVVAVQTGYPLYFWPFSLGMATAFAEIISKFNDEPLKALQTWHALCYHLLNGAVAVFALYFLALVAGTPPDFKGVTEMVQLQYAMAAGLGAMLVLRSKLFNIKVGDEDVSFGPEQMVKVIFNFMEAEIGRVRARDRMKFLLKYLHNIHFDSMYNHCLTMFRRAAQVLDADEKKASMEEIAKLKLDPDLDLQQKSYHLGFIFLDRMGERFVSDLFDKPLSKYLICAPGPEPTSGGVLSNFITVETDNALLKALPIIGTKEETVPYVAYGPNMSSARIRTLLNWIDEAGKGHMEKTLATGCRLTDYRVSFNMAPDGVGGFPNLVSEKGQEAEGVLYWLPKTALEFLKLKEEERGYHLIKVKAKMTEANGKETEVEADAFVANADRVGKESAPVREELYAMIEGAGEFRLSAEYQAQLKALTPFAAAPAPAGAVVETAGRNGEPVV